MFFCKCLFYSLSLHKSNKLKHAIAEFLDLTIDEVGDSVELVYTPVRADGLKGSPKTLVSRAVSPGECFGCFVCSWHLLANECNCICR